MAQNLVANTLNLPDDNDSIDTWKNYAKFILDTLNKSIVRLENEKEEYKKLYNDCLTQLIISNQSLNELNQTLNERNEKINQLEKCSIDSDEKSKEDDNDRQDMTYKLVNLSTYPD